MKYRLKNIINITIISFGLYPIMPNDFKGFFMIFLGITALMYHFTYKKSYQWMSFAVNSLLFFVYLISLFYTENVHHGIVKLGPALSILVFPLIFYILLGNYKISRKTIYSMLHLFSMATAVFMLIFIFYFKFYVERIFPDVDLLSFNYIRSYLRAIPYIGQHPIYVSYFIGISIISSTHQTFVFYKKHSKRYIFSGLLLLFHMFSLLLISSKGTISALLIVAIILFYPIFKSKMATFILSSFLIIFFIMSILYIPNVKNRFKELFKSKTYSFENPDERNSSQIRIAIWKTAVKNIKKSPVWGYGLGDVKDVLDADYRKNYPLLLKENYNSHNQYMDIWLSAGLPGLLVFIFFLYFNTKLAVQTRDFIFLALLLFFMINFLSENLIDRQTGATLFFFFVNLFGAYNNSKKVATP